VKVQNLIAAAAVLDGRTEPTQADLWPLILAVPTQEQQTEARERLRDVLQRSESQTLSTAAEEASLGPLARAAGIVRAGKEALAAQPADPSPQALDMWKLRLEGIAREIDAGFTTETIPTELAEIRRRIVAILNPVQAGQ
jgi:MoxR-like ATPase